MKGTKSVADNPALIREWDYEKNGKLDPNSVSRCSGRNIWWICGRGHSWQATPANRRNTGCPYCVNKKVLAGFNDLASQNPELAREWDDRQNGSLRPSMVSTGSTKKVWWKCNKGHSYQAAPGDRSIGRGCPYCAGRKVLPGFNDLKSQYPDIASEWDYERNSSTVPEMVTSGSDRVIWWKCVNGHSWKAPVSRRKTSGCPVCSGRVAWPGETDLQTLHPELMAEWDYEKNRGVDPSSLLPCSNKRVWWKCQLGHGWKISPNHRVGRKSGCPYCANKRVLAGYNDLASKHPELIPEWDMEKNEGRAPDEYVYLSNKKAWWKCAKGHSWETGISNRTRMSRGCPFCAGQRAVAGENDLASLAPDYLKEWDYEKNGDLTPDEVMLKSGKMVWWKCGNGHSWKARVYSRVKTGCPYCSGRFAIKGETDLASQMPLLAEEWDYGKNNGLSPDEVACQSNRNVWWRCNNGHSWRAAVCDRATGNGCPRCNGKIKMWTHYIS